jgi:tripartite-type tricarboxylate transporter receptor subunit TctC
MRRRHFLTAAGAAIAAPAIAQTGYPDKPIRVIVPNAPGGAADILARTFQRPLERQLGQPVVIANVVGGGTSIGNRQARDAAPDGHTVLAIHQALLAAAALRVQDFGPEALEKVAQIGSEYVGVVVNKSSPIQGLPDLLNMARAGNARAGVQIGAWNHFLFLSLASATGVRFRFVNTGSGGPTRTALAGNHIEAAYLSLTEAKPLIASGDLRMIAYMAPQGPSDVPEVKTAREQGIDLTQATNFWWWMPKNTPRDRVDRFAEALRAALGEAETAQRLREMAVTPAFLKGAELEAEIDRQYQFMQRLARENNLVPA